MSVYVFNQCNTKKIIIISIKVVDKFVTSYSPKTILSKCLVLYIKIYIKNEKINKINRKVITLAIYKSVRKDNKPSCATVQRSKQNKNKVGENCRVIVIFAKLADPYCIKQCFCLRLI